MRSKSLLKLTIGALLTAFTCIATMVIAIPIIGTQGYVNIGDAMVIVSGLLLGKKYGALIGGAGSALADIFLGYSFYAPITLLVKGIEGWISGSGSGRKHPFISVISAVFWMPIGYFIADSLMFNVAYALPSFIPNFVQGLVGGVIALILYPILQKLLSKRGLSNNKI